MSTPAYLQIYYFLRILPVSKIQIHGKSGAEKSAPHAPAPSPLPRLSIQDEPTNEKLHLANIFFIFLSTLINSHHHQLDL